MYPLVVLSRLMHAVVVAQVLAPECNFTVNFETKWFMTQSLPLVLGLSIVSIVMMTRLLQQAQRFIFHVVPFGATAQLSLVDASIGILITGVYHLYFGETASRCVRCVVLQSRFLLRLHTHTHTHTHNDRHGAALLLRVVLLPVLVGPPPRRPLDSPV